MPAMHGAIQAVISLYALGLMAGIGMVISNRASHTVPYSIGARRGSLLLSLVYEHWASQFDAEDFGDARDVCEDPGRDFAWCVWPYARHRLGQQRWSFAHCSHIRLVVIADVLEML
jgi:hypothetical protein